MEEIRKLAKPYFEEIDTDKNGTISNKEFCKYIQHKKLLNFSNAHEVVEECFFIMDRDGNDEIDFEEFCYFMRAVNNQNGIDYKCNYPKLLFDLMDIDQSGTIEMNEIRRLNQLCSRENASEESAKILFNNLDLNKDGVIQYEEFLTAFQ